MVFNQAKKNAMLSCFNALDINNSKRILLKDLSALFTRSGFTKENQKIKGFVEILEKVGKEKTEIDFNTFLEILSDDVSLYQKIFEKQLIIPEFEQFTQIVKNIFDEVKFTNIGKVANYIPELKKVNPDQFAVSICTVDGQQIHLGNANSRFCIQSMCKPVLYNLAVRELGIDKVHRHVGREPSGRYFNELALNSKGCPHNPMINAGAIMTSSLIKRKSSPSTRYNYFLSTIKKLCGNQHIGFDNSVFTSEKKTADRNFALAYFMREHKSFPKGINIDEVLDFYFQTCSVTVTSNSMSILAASLANAGICPITGEEIFAPGNIKHCLSLMDSCGMYDYSGEWAFLIGLPAKSGISGGIFIVIPDVMGICIWSPKLDQHGNSYRGIEFAKQFVNAFSVHGYDSVIKHEGKLDPVLNKFERNRSGIYQLLEAASNNDLESIIQLCSKDINLNDSDYDKRTALHLACSEGHTEIFNYLIAKNVNLFPIDRWNNTPLDDAKRHNHNKIVEIYSALK